MKESHNPWFLIQQHTMRQNYFNVEINKIWLISKIYDLFVFG